MATDTIPFLIFSFSFAKPISHNVRVRFFIDLCQTFISFNFSSCSEVSYQLFAIPSIPRVTSSQDF